MWTAKVTIDKDKTDVGTAAATYTDGDFTFTYSKRARLTAAERDAFVAEAKEALANRQVQLGRNANFSDNLTNALNA